MRDLHQKRASLDYPIGGAGAVIDALVRGIETGVGAADGMQGVGDRQQSGKVLVNSHVSRIIVENGRAVGVQLRQKSKVLSDTCFGSSSAPIPSHHFYPTDIRHSRPSELSSPMPVCGTQQSYYPRGH